MSKIFLYISAPKIDLQVLLNINIVFYNGIMQYSYVSNIACPWKT